MEAEARATLLAEGLNEDQIQIERGFDLRYMGQHHEVPVTIPAGKIDETMLPEIKKRFNDAHNRLFLYSEPESPLESINIRLTGLGIIPKTSLTSWQTGGKDSSEAIKGSRKAYFGELGGWVDTQIFDGSKLKAGNIIEGPAIIEEVTTTIVVNPYDKATIDRLGNVVIEINALKKF